MISQFWAASRSTETRARNALQRYRGIEWSVPETDIKIFTQRLDQLDEVFNEIVQHPSIREKQEILRKLEATYGPAPKPPVWMLATGRCGTLALDNFLNKSERVSSHHRNHLITMNYSEINEFLYRLVTGRFDTDSLLPLINKFFGATLYGIVRCLQDHKQYIFASHSHTIFAPIAMRLFEGARFIYLKRNPIDVFHSFLLKDQYHYQLEPMYINRNFSPRYIDKAHRRSGFTWVPAFWPLWRKIVWYLYVTDAFSHAFRDFAGDGQCQFHASEDLFGRKEHAYELLRDIFAIDDLNLQDFNAHFANSINEKPSASHLSDRAVRKISRSAQRMIGQLQLSDAT